MGRRPIGRKAMTPAQRQARRRARLKKEAKERGDIAKWGHPESQPPHGYQQAKDKLIAQGHVFMRARSEWGHEGGVYVDGAFLGTTTVIKLAGMAREGREPILEEGRRWAKSSACSDVVRFMEAMRVTPAEFVHYLATIPRPAAEGLNLNLLGERMEPSQPQQKFRLPANCHDETSTQLGVKVGIVGPASKK